MNNKGFMMAEVIVVSAIILVALSTLYLSYNKIYTIYSTRLNYYDSVTLYRLGYYRDILIENNLMNNVLANAKSDKVVNIYDSENNSGSVFTLSAAERPNNAEDRVFLIYNNKDALPSDLLDSYNVNQTFKDYVIFLSTSVKTNSNYMMIMERCSITSNTVNKDNCKYAYLEIYDGIE